MKTILIFGTIFAAIVGWFLVAKYSGNNPDIISRNGIHWHPHMAIVINGQEREIPENIGMTPREFPIHTHDKDGIIHLEFAGLVKKDDIRLGEFFEIWGKTFNGDCIFDKCSGTDGQMKMLVNGKENSDFENYMMQDEDKIEIIFDKEAGMTGQLIVDE